MLFTRFWIRRQFKCSHFSGLSQHLIGPKEWGGLKSFQTRVPSFRSLHGWRLHSCPSSSYLLARLAQNQLDTEPEGHTEHVARLMKMQIAADQVVRAHLDAMLAMT